MKPINNNFGNKFVNDVAENNGPKIFDLRTMFNLGDQRNMDIIYGTNIISIIHETRVIFVNYLLFKNIPIFL